MGKGAENTESDLSLSPSLYYMVTINLTINTTVVGATRPAQPPWILGRSPSKVPQPRRRPSRVLYTIYSISILFLFFDPPSRQRVCKEVASVRLSVQVSVQSLVKARPARGRQLSESKSLLPSSSLFSAGDDLAGVDEFLFHFSAFSDSSEEERFCRLHLARRFLNQTCPAADEN